MRDWTISKIWQPIEQGHVPGITSTSVDLDWFDGSYDDLLAYAHHTPVPINAGQRMNVIPQTLNVRGGPGVNFGVVGTLRQGDVAGVLNVDGGDAWGQFATGKWAAIAFRGNRFMNIS